MFGRPVPTEIVEKRGAPVRYWGARAIFYPRRKHPIEILPDRQQCQCADGLDPKPLLEWLNTVGMKELQKLRDFKLLTGDSSAVVQFSDGEFTVQCSPNASFGYLYLGAWQHWPANCLYEQKTPHPTAKWSSDKFPVPAIGARIKANFNGPWEGAVSGYFVEYGYQGVEVDCSQGKWPDFYKRQGGDAQRVLLFGADLTAVETDCCPKRNHEPHARPIAQGKQQEPYHAHGPCR